MAAIVIEGPDGTGKTTLARAFEARGFVYHHCDPPAEGIDLFDHYLDLILLARKKDVVFDRLHLGEYVYGPVMRGGSRLTLNQLRFLNRAVHPSPGFIILCDMNESWIVDRWRANVDREYVKDEAKFKRVIQGFRELRDNLYRIGRFEYDFIRFGVHQNEFVRGIVDRLKTFGRHPIDGYSGEPYPEFLFVGERPGGKVDLGFCSEKNSSGFLNYCLVKAGFVEPEIGFINAFDKYNLPRDLHKIWLELYQPKVVALGLEAQNACKKFKIPYEGLPHPSYWKRFHAKNLQGYVELLQDVRRY
ncbi:MAG TPA: hypothetical protein VKT80_18285 [Chloroflexota bacterium]|nr:hypothetical protein [Chloroflexota bacterium]